MCRIYGELAFREERRPGSLRYVCTKCSTSSDPVNRGTRTKLQLQPTPPRSSTQTFSAEPGIKNYNSLSHSQLRGGGHLPPINVLVTPAASREGGGDGGGAGGGGSAGNFSSDLKQPISREGSGEAAHLSDGDARSAVSRQSTLDRPNGDQEQPTLQKAGTADSAAFSKPGAASEDVLGKPIVPKQRRMSRIGRQPAEAPAPAKEAGGEGGGRGRRPSYLKLSNNAAAQAGGDRRNFNIGKMSAMAVAKVTSGLLGGEQEWASSRRSIAPRAGMAHRRWVASSTLNRAFGLPDDISARLFCPIVLSTEHHRHAQSVS